MSLKGRNGLKGLNINTEIDQKQMAQEMAGHLGNHSSAQANNGFRQQALDIAACILDFMKDTFDALPNTAQPAVQAARVLNILV